MAGRLALGGSRDNLRLDAPGGELRHGRASSDTPRPSNLGRGAAAPGSLSPEGTGDAPANKRLGFFGDKTSPSGGGGAGAQAAAQRSGSTIPAALLPPRSHSRADSAMSAANVSRENMNSPVPSSQTPRPHLSPSKNTAPSRTYDSKLVSREMHRLGNLTHLPSALAPALAAAASASVSTLSLPQPALVAPPIPSTQTDNPWGLLHVYLLPLFNGEPLRIPIEELNALVRKHIGVVISAAPHKALSTLEHDVSELLGLGMVTLNAKLNGLEDEKLVIRVIETWGFFWDQVLTYIEGSLLPMQTDPLLQSLYRKTRRPSSPHRKPSVPALDAGPQIDVRSIALRAFRDRVILPVAKSLATFLSAPRQDSLARRSEYEQSRLQQMLLVLVSQAREHAQAMSLTEPTPQPTQGEAAVSHLLRALRAPQLHGFSSPGAPRAPSFLSSKLPRDRRGRIEARSNRMGFVGTSGERGGGRGRVDEDEAEGEETPRTTFAGVGLGDQEREFNREFLEALRSPTYPEQDARHRAGGGGGGGGGGWGLDGGQDYVPRADEEEDEEPLDWDQAQAAVERMVGMKPAVIADSGGISRRRMT